MASRPRASIGRTAPTRGCARRGNLAVTGQAHTAAHRRGRNPGDVWTLPTRPYRGAHTAPFPFDIPLRAIAAGCPPGGHVLDPFSGAGTTAWPPCNSAAATAASTSTRPSTTWP
jgi:hypothetical protein